ncbi:MAG TPA: endonuclease III [Bacillota bacterium]|nr:endonuclease III [Bacillota bacterium]
MDKTAKERLPRVPVKKILAELAAAYPEARTALDFANPFQLLVATMLSAQCTDKTVNSVTPGLFARAATPAEMAGTPVEEIGALIQRCGLWRSKAQHIHDACAILASDYGNEVPADHAALVSLPGVGRKTANVVVSNAFSIPAIAVDTHVFRVANRLGLAAARTPEETERQLMRRIPRRDWAQAHHWLIWHGRQVCVARNPRCGACTLLAYCPTGKALSRAPARKGGD